MATVDIVVVGQSNALGQTNTRVNTTTAAQGAVLAWYENALGVGTDVTLKRIPWSPLDSRYKTYEYTGSRQFTGVPEAITHQLSVSYSHSVRLFTFAVGASRYYDHWADSWTTGYGFTEQAQHGLAQALASRKYPGTPSRRIIVSIHGESDAADATAAAAYDTSLGAVVTALRNTLSNANTHAVIVQLHSSCSSANTATVRTKQSDWVAAQGASKATLIDGSTYTLHSDNLHYTEAGAQNLGYGIADIIHGLL